jgi:hypothetical protein
MSVWITGIIAVAGYASSADSARKSRNAQQGATDANNALANRQFEEDKRRYDLNREDQERWGMMQINGEEEFDRRNRADKEMAYQRGAGLNKGSVDRGEKAGNQLAYLMGLGGTGTGEAGSLARNFTMADYQKDPSYDFQMSEGQKGVGNQMAASGNLLSGAAMKALTRFNQDFAGTKYNEAYSRFGNNQSTQYNRLAGIQGSGQNAINSTNGLGGTVQGSAGNGASGVASGLGSAAAQFGQSSNNYYNNLMGNNNASANAQSAYNTAFGNTIGSGLGNLAGTWNSYQKKNNNTNNYSYPTQNSGGYDYLDF